ncbi:MAG: ferritin-like domain-containing protein [Acidimicrobiales bacterium]
MAPCGARSSERTRRFPCTSTPSLRDVKERRKIAAILRSVVVEEMPHVVLRANIVHARGATAVLHAGLRAALPRSAAPSGARWHRQPRRHLVARPARRPGE